MPRIKKELNPYWVVDPQQMVLNAINRKSNLIQEMFDEIAISPLLHYWVPNYAGGGYDMHYVFVLTKHLPLCLMEYKDADRGGEWPVPPLYSAPEANDIVELKYVRFTTLQPFRSLELKDMNLTIQQEDATKHASLTSYLNDLYFDRTKNKWTGYTFDDGAGGSNIMPPDYANINWDSVFDIDQFGATQYTLVNLYNVWKKAKLVFEGNAILLKDIAAIYAPPEEVPISNHNIPLFQLVDRRNERFLKYSVTGDIIGTDDSKNLITGNPPLIHLFYDISIVQVNGIDYVVQVNPIAPITAKNTKMDGQYVTLMSTLANWLAYKVKLDIPLAETEEWWPGSFPKTPYNHMVFYGGHSFYIPDGFTIEANLTRLFKEAGYLGIRFIADLINYQPYAIPMRNTVAYGRWMEYMPPDKVRLKEIFKKQYWTLANFLASGSLAGLHVIESKEGAMEVGKNGTIGVAVVPGVSFIAANFLGGK